VVEGVSPVYEIIDIEVELVKKALPLDKADQLTVSELRGNYFDFHIIRPEMIFLRLGEEVGELRADGTIRLITRRKTPEKALKSFNILINIAKKLIEFDENTELFNFDIVLILYFESKRGAKNIITRFIGEEKLNFLQQILNEKNVVPYLGIYIRDFGKDEFKDRIDMDIEPASKDAERYYWIKIRRELYNEKGIASCKDYIDEMIEKASVIVKALEGIEIV
jgi:hypothetical protein